MLPSMTQRCLHVHKNSPLLKANDDEKAPNQDMTLLITEQGFLLHCEEDDNYLLLEKLSFVRPFCFPYKCAVVEEQLL